MKKDLLQTLKILLASIVLSFGISYVYAWTGPLSAPPTGNTPAPVNIGAIDQVKAGGLGVGAFTADSALFSGSITAASVAISGSVTADSAVISGNITSSGTICDSNGCVGTATAETDPTVIASVKDGVSWAEVSARPSSLNNGDQVRLLQNTTVSGSGSSVTLYCPSGYITTGANSSDSVASIVPIGQTGWRMAASNRGATLYVKCIRLVDTTR